MKRRHAILAVTLVVLALAAPALAQEHGATPAGKNIFQYIGAAFAIGIAAAFGSLGQGRGLSAACEAIGRNPGAVGPIRITMIIGLALIESLVIYALIIAFLILA
ncbi:MAG TPA: ATP synthase F0 subunit C [Thermoanaerobaculales bacterium]|nr:ATP synthase F0 subunit C [Thermoanaerobaculales bacterium]HPA82317.1 ATP synthase F0 subunit C [Thermoanaerobaculales bacterium]HQL30557.1 ATP synthase F0 subunit C [Thermoanaerobaculales bacterium]HQP43596.1 ATP synthase F0 subunit C [Thermoanaerobaculales bacterium]